MDIMPGKATRHPVTRKAHAVRRLHAHVTRHAKTVARHAKDHFIPHEGNGHRPHVLKHRVLIGYTAIAILLKTLVILVAIASPKVDLLADALTAANVINLTNQTRVASGLPLLQTDGALMTAAAAKANDMLANQYFAHTSPSGTSPWYWFRWAGYRYDHAAENLAVHYLTAETVEEGWLASAGHRKNIMNPAFVDTGVGVIFGRFEDADTAFVVQLFAVPTPPPVVPAEAGTPPKIEPTPSVVPAEAGTPPKIEPTPSVVPAEAGTPPTPVIPAQAGTQKESP
ncbi:MAG: CAP domain-containing protein, partial [Patescibacteria group bacterium]